MTGCKPMCSNDSDDWPDNFHVWHVLTSRLLFDSYDSYAIFSKHASHSQHVDSCLTHQRPDGRIAMLKPEIRFSSFPVLRDWKLRVHGANFEEFETSASSIWFDKKGSYLVFFEFYLVFYMVFVFRCIIWIGDTYHQLLLRSHFKHLTKKPRRLAPVVSSLRMMPSLRTSDLGYGKVRLALGGFLHLFFVVACSVQ